MTLCVVHPTRRPPEALPDSKACAACVEQLGQDLATVDLLLPRLRALLEPGRDGQDAGRRGGYSAPAPLRVDVLSLLDARGGAEDVLKRWARAAGTQPTGAGIRGRLSWFIEQDDHTVKTFARDIRALAADMRRACGHAHLADETPPEPRKVATCRRDIRGRECGGPILVAPGAEVAICSRCREGWTRDRWLFLARLDADRTTEQAG